MKGGGALKKKVKKFLKPVFIIYAVVMLWLLFGQRWGWDTGTAYLVQLREKINLIPFRTIQLFIRLAEHTSSRHELKLAVINLLGNVIMFIPLGLLPFIYEKLRCFWKYLLCVVLTVCTIEAVQLFTLLGSMDIDDFLLNILGALIGFLFYKVIDKHII